MDALDQVLERIKRSRENAKATGIPAPQYSCNVCKDTGFVFKRDANNNEVAAFCECRENKLALRLMANSGISAEDTKKGFEDFNTFSESGLVNAKQIAARYCRHFTEIRDTRNNSLLLCGASGRGKTTLGMAVANNLIRDCVGVRYMPYRDEITRLKQELTVKDDGHAYNEHMHRLKTAKVLFIDDMLKGKVTESDINIMYEIINYRYLDRLPIIISTEKLPSDLLDFDEAIGSRIMEMCKGYVITFDSSIPNYRMR